MSQCPLGFKFELPAFDTLYIVWAQINYVPHMLVRDIVCSGQLAQTNCKVYEKLGFCFKPEREREAGLCKRVVIKCTLFRRSSQRKNVREQDFQTCI